MKDLNEMYEQVEIDKLKKNTDEELNDIFAKEVLDYEDYVYEMQHPNRSIVGYKAISGDGKEIFIQKDQVKPTVDRNQAHYGIRKCPGRLYFLIVCELVRQRYSEANDFEMFGQAQDYIQSTCREMVIGCILSRRAQM